jgi:hypothetical protein
MRFFRHLRNSSVQEFPPLGSCILTITEPDVYYLVALSEQGRTLDTTRSDSCPTAKYIIYENRNESKREIVGDVSSKTVDDILNRVRPQHLTHHVGGGLGTGGSNPPSRGPNFLRYRALLAGSRCSCLPISH